jgi:hypothetical protein
MIVFLFDYETGAYTGMKRLGINDCDARDPGTVLVPGNATVFVPPRCGANLWPFWRDGRWQVFELVTAPEPEITEADYWAMT